MYKPICDLWLTVMVQYGWKSEISTFEVSNLILWEKGSKSWHLDTNGFHNGVLTSRRVRHKSRKLITASSCLSVRLYYSGTHLTDFRELWYRKLLQKSVEKIQIWLQSGQKYRALYRGPKYIYIADLLVCKSAKESQCYTSMANVNCYIISEQFIPVLLLHYQRCRINPVKHITYLVYRSPTCFD